MTNKWKVIIAALIGATVVGLTMLVVSIGKDMISFFIEIMGELL